MIAKGYITKGNPDPDNRIDILELGAMTFADQALLAAIIKAIALNAGKGQSEIKVMFPDGSSMTWVGNDDIISIESVPKTAIKMMSPKMLQNLLVDEYYNILGEE